jgi:hypothetical protein
MRVKRPHMVTKGYLRAWADGRNLVDVLDVQHGLGYPSSIENATVVGSVYEPEVLTRDLEGDYALVETGGLSVINKLRTNPVITSQEHDPLIAFLDMHLERGRHADQAEIRTPAVLLRTNGQTEDSELTLADRLLLGRYVEGVIRLTSLGLEQWRWRVCEARHLATGDGAVLLWAPTDGAEICSISFPLSPTQLLVIGDDLPERIPINQALASKCRRWIVSAPGHLDLSQGSIIAARRAQS